MEWQDWKSQETSQNTGHPTQNPSQNHLCCVPRSHLSRSHPPDPNQRQTARKPLLSHLIKGKERKQTESSGWLREGRGEGPLGRDLLWTVGDRGLIVLRSLKYKCPQWEEGGQSELTRWAHTPVSWSGAYAEEVARCSERDRDKRGPSLPTGGEGARRHQHWRFTLKGTCQLPSKVPSSPSPIFWSEGFGG